MPNNEATVNHIPLRTEHDLIEAHEQLINGFLTGAIESTKAQAVARLLRGSTFLITELPYRKLNLLAKLQMKNIDLPEKLLQGFVQGEK